MTNLEFISIMKNMYTSNILWDFIDSANVIYSKMEGLEGKINVDYIDSIANITEDVITFNITYLSDETSTYDIPIEYFKEGAEIPHVKYRY